ncbi:MAG: glycosyltransferase family 2 protein [Pseudomonadales bacterium]
MECNPCVLVPIYNQVVELPGALLAANSLRLPVILVNDGSDEQCSITIQTLAQEHNTLLVTHLKNKGKGAAIKSGLQKAQGAGFTHALQIDADGQHNTDDIPRFLQVMRTRADALVAGYPQFDESIPGYRFYGRYATHIWVWINTLSLRIRDSMCGFRVYPVAASCDLINTERIGNRMDFDCEFIVRWYWRGYAIEQLQTKVIYPEGGDSNFRIILDNMLITRMHARLFFGMLRRLPRLLKRRGAGNDAG